MIEDSNYLMHYGTKYHSGRFPYGSGDNPYQHDEKFLKRIKELRDSGMSDNEIAKSLNYKSIQDFKDAYSVEINLKKVQEIERIQDLKDKGYSNQAIADKLGLSGESAVRSKLEPIVKARAMEIQDTAEKVREQVEKDNFVDISRGANFSIGVSEDRLKKAVYLLENKMGYKRHEVYIDQAGTDHKTTITVLTKPDQEYADFYKNHLYDIVPLGLHKAYDPNGNIMETASFDPVSISSKRVQVVYREDGGTDKDGLIEIRRGCEDLSLGNARYAQVRIAVDGTHYLKGMAVYADDLPKGVDIRFNSNKKKGTPLIDNETEKKDRGVLKPMKEDPANPFGASILDEDHQALTQKYYIDKNGKQQKSALNIVNEEGTWETWSKNLPSQFLSKQYTKVAQGQLKIDLDMKKLELAEINSYENPEIKKYLLEKFANECDSAAVDLQAASFPRQQTHTILPLPDIKPTEIYAPNYKNGEHVCLIRYPHQGIFEIPELIVNNNNKEGRNIIGSNAPDAVGIHPKVAEQLSGADFDGDSVVVIPVNDRVKIRHQAPLKDLEGFDAKLEYPEVPGMKVMKSERQKGIEMGKITNLITDMTFQKATEDELVRAVKHAQVVIDAYKHHLNYDKSYRDNNIAELKKKYQGGHGAATIISRSKSPERIHKRKEIVGINQYNTDPETGKRIYKDDPKADYINKKGQPSYLTDEVYKMELVDDAFDLTSGGRKNSFPMEIIYANYANGCKELARTARKEYLKTSNSKMNSSAKKTYAKEVQSLNDQLLLAKKNAPLERQAQLLANQMVAAQLESNPDMDREHIRKAKGRAIQAARQTVGAKKRKVEISPKEWEAIEAGALSSTKVQEILNNTDIDVVRNYATPHKETRALSQAKINAIKAMLDAGQTQQEVAERFNVSASYVSKISRQ